MRLRSIPLTIAICIGGLTPAASAQSSDPAWLKPAARVSAAASIESPNEPRRPGTLALIVDVRLAPGIHVYAPGSKDYIPVELAVAPMAGVKTGAAQYPPSETFVFGELKEVVQVYARPFQIRVPLTVRPDVRERAVAATLRVQACTDKVCFPPETLPLSVALPAAPARKSP
jgi:DsbC/DsbD-like thiol-disulfide interchange protein